MFKFLLVAPTGQHLAGTHGELQTLEQAEAKAREMACVGGPVHVMLHVGTAEVVKIVTRTALADEPEPAPKAKR
jgi:hypothetical protein